MKKKIRILHLWNNQSEAERVIRELAETGLEFEAKLVKTQTEYVSALLIGQFHLIILDSQADFGHTAPGDLSAREIALELAPDTVFAQIDGPECDPRDTADSGDPSPAPQSVPYANIIQVPRGELDRLREVLKAL